VPAAARVSPVTASVTPPAAVPPRPPAKPIPAEPPADGPIDRELALSRTGGDPDILREVAELVLENIPKWLAEMRDSLEMQDWRTLGRLAHTLKSSADNVGARQGVVLAERLERLANEHDLDASQLALAKLEAELARLLPALSRFTSELQAAAD